MQRIIFLLFIPVLFLSTKITGQSLSYLEKKDSALKVVSPFELIASNIKKDVILEFEDSELMVFESSSKQAPVHLLIVPKKRINTVNEIELANQNMLGKMILLAKDMAKKKGVDKTGYRLVLNTNEDAGQSVFHLHMHLLGGLKLGPMVDQTYRNKLKQEVNK